MLQKSHFYASTESNQLSGVLQANQLFTPSKYNFHFLSMSDFRSGFTPPNYTFLTEVPLNQSQFRPPQSELGRFRLKFFWGILLLSLGSDYRLTWALERVRTQEELILRLNCILSLLFSPQQIDEIWKDMRWITDALQYARYKQPAAGLPIKKLVDLSEEHSQKKMSSTSSHLDCLPSPPPSPEPRIQRRKAVSGKRTFLCSPSTLFELTFNYNSSCMSFHKRSKFLFPLLLRYFNNHFTNHLPLSILRSFYNLYSNFFTFSYSE